MARMDPNGLRHGVPDRAGEDPARGCGKYDQLHHLGIFKVKRERSEKPETRYGLVCSYIRISGEDDNKE